MQNTATHSHSTTAGTDDSSRFAELQQLTEHVAHLLPAQGPITVFVHHNTMHAFEELAFDDAVKVGPRMFGCQTYLSEDRYRQMLERERIRSEDLTAALLEDLGEHDDDLIGNLGTRFQLRRAMLQYPLCIAPAAELRWLVAETDALRKFRSECPAAVRRRMIETTRRWVMRDLRNGALAQTDAHARGIRESLHQLVNSFGAGSIESWREDTWESVSLHLLWRIARQGVHGIKRFSPPPPPHVRHRDLLLEASGVDADQLVHDLLIRLCASFLDQGMAHWPMPFRKDGLYQAFLHIYQQPAGPPDRWLDPLPEELRRLDREGIGPLASIDESLELLGVEADERESFLAATLLALRGYAGMIWQMETRGDRVARPAPAGSLVEFLAVRLILERLALCAVARESLGYAGPLRDLRSAARARVPKRDSVSVDQRALLVFQLAQVVGWMPNELYQLSKPEWIRLIEEIESFTNIDRRRVYQNAYERRYRVQTLDALLAHASHAAPLTGKPSFQVVCCIDDREESFRRHLEELEPSCETFGVAGFFAVAMYYRGAADAHFVPLCPIVVRPQHWVDEVAAYTFEESDRRRAQTRRMLGAATHQVHVGSRTFAGGALLTALVGPLASIPLIFRVLFPRLTAQLRRLVGRLVQPPPVTQLRLERPPGTNPGPQEDQFGYTVQEMAIIVERLLRDIGLTSQFARLLIILGHGSSSLNNPHESAYNCGACAGARGGPNARALAQMANDPRVRELVARRGLVLPEDLFFVGAFHNTCDDSVTYFGLDRLPPSHWDEFDRARGVIDRARERNAHERCRRFESAPLNLTAEAALRHVEARAEDLAQTRPEFNHATNALCIVGRRWRTRGLFMDRRAFLTSYDPTHDDSDLTILTRILQAVVPVCAGISLEYYFSCVDPAGWGCSTKLPHNLTSLLGVMDGAASDLRTGLSSQMIEIHEPMRLLFVIETTPAALLQIMERNPAIARLCRNGWVQVATLDPHSARIHLFVKDRMEPYEPEDGDLPDVDSSSDWYRGWRDHLGFAVVKDGLPSAIRAGATIGAGATIDEGATTRDGPGNGQSRT